MVLPLGFLRPVSISIYKDKKVNVRQLKVHPLARLKKKNLFARLSLFQSARAMISKRFIKRANNLKPAKCSCLNNYVY